MSDINYPQVAEVIHGSIADELGIQPGDIIISINGEPLLDVIGYKFLLSEDYIEVEVLKNGDRWIYEIEKNPDEDIGIIFKHDVFDQIRRCKNKCIFCFLDQMPKKMRDSLYVKDDDYRLSFLHGNYITLTNISELDLVRIIKLNLSPLYVSVHATDEHVREKMLQNKDGRDIFECIKRFTSAGIKLHTQIVLVPELNDGQVMEKTLKDLASLHPNVLSVAIVPVGITKYRDKLTELRSFSPQESKSVIECVAKWQHKMLQATGEKMIFASDEFFINAEEPIPEENYYDNHYQQLENGIGLVRKLWNDFERGKDKLKKYINPVNKKLLILTGQSGEIALSPIASWINSSLDIKLKVEPVENNFFGKHITVTGLVTGTDISSKLDYMLQNNLITSDEVVLVPSVMLQEGSEIFLDDITITQLSEKHHLKIKIVHSDGEGLIEALISELEVA